MANGVGDIFGEFMRETLLQTAYLRFEVGRLKGLSEAAALDSSVAFMEQDFNFIQRMIEEHGLPWETLEAEIRRRVRDAAANNDPMRIATPKELGN